MPNKENLERLKAVVLEKGIVRERYYEEGSCCVVGHAVSLMGNDDLVDLLKEHNYESITVSDLGSVTNAVRGYYGISATNILDLQMCNDESEDSGRVLKLIDNLINQE